MPEFDVEAFVANLERMGVKLTAVPLADGKTRINRWRMLHAVDHAKQIDTLWASQIGENQARIDLLAHPLYIVRVAEIGRRMGRKNARTDDPRKAEPDECRL